MSALPLKATKIEDIAGPIRSNVDLLRNGEGIIQIDAEIPDGALYLGVTEQ